MNKKELIELLEKYPDDMKIKVNDRGNSNDIEYLGEGIDYSGKFIVIGGAFYDD